MTTTFNISIHLKTDFDWGPISRFLPETLGLSSPEGEELKGLMFTDDAGNAHVFAFSEDGRQQLVKALTGGVILPHVNGGS